VDEPFYIIKTNHYEHDGVSIEKNVDRDKARNMKEDIKD
jgi:hypothetical protein